MPSPVEPRMIAAQQYCTSVLSARMGPREILAASLCKLLILLLSRILGLQHPTGEYKHFHQSSFDGNSRQGLIAHFVPTVDDPDAPFLTIPGGDDSVVGTRVEDAQVCYFFHQLMLPCKSTEPYLTGNLCTQRPRMLFSVDILCDLFRRMNGSQAFVEAIAGGRRQRSYHVICRGEEKNL